MMVPYTGELDSSATRRAPQSLSFAVAGPLTSKSGTVVANFAGTFSVTAFDFNEASGPISLTGILDGTATYFDTATESVSFVNHLVTTTATLKHGTGISSASSIYHLAAAGSSVPLLNLGPLELYPLGLVAELNEIVLDITVQTGSNSLLGTLLCALTGPPTPHASSPELSK